MPSRALKWLVTGAAGFIGSNLIAHLLCTGDEVVGLDDFSTGKRSNVDRVSRTDGARGLAFYEGSILDRDLLARTMRGVDVVVHLAAQVSVQRSFDDATYTNAVNVGGFLEVERAAAEAGVGRLVYASSCAVYGDAPELPLGEDTRPRPLSPYAVSKLVDEHYAEALRQRHPEMDAVGLRFFNIYGPWQDHNGGYAAVIPRWIDACIRGERPILFGDGSASRDFCYVGDLAKVIERIGRDGTSGARRVFNVGTGVGTTLAELYDAIAAALAARDIAVPPEGPLHQPWRPGDIVHSRGDIELLRAAIGFGATTDLAEGLGEILHQQYGLPRH